MTILVPVDSGQLQSRTGVIRSIDLSVFADTDFITAACPDFPVDTLDLDNSFLRFTSNPTADFDAGPTAALAFSDAQFFAAFSDYEARWPMSLVVNRDMPITGVQWVIEATDDCTFTCMAIRAMSANWVVAPIDINTLYGRLQQPVPLNGAASNGSFAFPQATSPVVPELWPIIYRSATPAGLGDPRPIDVTIHASISTGTCDSDNTFALYLRELSLDEMTQLDLDGETMADLDATGSQPDFGLARFNNRTQADFDTIPQSALDTNTQFDLERSQDFLSSAYIEVKLVWDADGGTLTIKDAQDIGYSFSPDIEPSTNYIIVATIEDESIRVRIFHSDSQEQIEWAMPVFDSTTIIDGAFVHRRRGRIGWWAELNDGDAFINYLRPSFVNYGEYLSHPFLSSTPVAGAAVYAGSSPDRDLFTEIAPTSDGVSVVPDATKSTSGRSYKIVTTGTKPPEGITTNLMYLDNVADTTISFNLFIPSTDGLEVYLTGEFGRVVELPLPPLVINRWQTITVDMEALADTFQPGNYQLAFIQSIGNVITTWYVDVISVKSRTMRWEVRPNPDDAWGMDKEEWLPVKSTLNTGDGVVFAEEGNAIQLRGQARTGDAFITDIKIVPKYAELGRFVWADEVLDPTTGPSPIFIMDEDDSPTITFDASSATPAAGRTIIAWLWNFGDGHSDLGKVVTHTYETTGVDYTVTLTVIDDRNNRSTDLDDVST